MAKRRLTVDRTELVAKQLGNNYWRAEIDRQAMRDKNVMTYYHNQSWRTVSVKAEEIRRITVMPVRTRVLWIFSYADEKIAVERLDGQEVFFLRSREGAHFDEYRRELERFARENGITFSDLTAGGGYARRAEAKRNLVVDRRELTVRHYTELLDRVEDRPGYRNARGGWMYVPPKLMQTSVVSAEQIKRIHVGEVVTPQLFGVLRMRDDRILIETGDGQRLSLLRSREGALFDEYRRELERFAEENNITFSDAMR